MNSLKKSIAQEFKDSKQFSLFDAYESFPEKPHETVRARIYDGLARMQIIIYRKEHIQYRYTLAQMLAAFVQNTERTTRCIR